MNISIIFDGRVNSDKKLSGNTVSCECEVNDLKEFAEVAMKHHICMATFENLIKRNDKVEQIQLLGIDFDDGTLSADIHEQCKTIANHIILASKNHNKEKHGNDICERFHLFIPLDAPLTNPKKYTDLFLWLCKIHRWKADEGCKDASRYYYKHSQILYSWNNSIDLPAELYLYNKSAYELKEQKRILRAQRKKLDNKYFVEKGLYANVGSPLENFKRTYAYKHLVNGDLQNDGERYNLSSRIIGVANTVGLDHNTLMGLFDEYVCYGDKCTRESIEQRIRKWII